MIKHKKTYSLLSQFNRFILDESMQLNQKKSTLLYSDILKNKNDKKSGNCIDTNVLNHVLNPKIQQTAIYRGKLSDHE